jgi:hypothetical protein
MATEKHKRGRTEKEKLTGVRAAAMERRRWSGGELAVEDPISPSDIRKRSSGGGKEGEDAIRRRAEAPECRRATAAEHLLCSSVRW